MKGGEAMNRNMLVLSVVAAIFLPLGLVTGLRGVNVGGIPGASITGPSRSSSGCLSPSPGCRSCCSDGSGTCGRGCGKMEERS